MRCIHGVCAKDSDTSTVFEETIVTLTKPSAFSATVILCLRTSELKKVETLADIVSRHLHICLANCL